MTLTQQWRSVSYSSHLLAQGSRLSLTPRIFLRAASLSAIHRGLRRSDKVQYGGSDSASRRSPQRGVLSDRTAKAFEGTRSPRQQHKLSKKLRRAAEEDDQDPGKQTRRKRFFDENNSHGKSSLVYQLQHGQLKDVADKIKLREPERPRDLLPSERRQRLKLVGDVPDPTRRLSKVIPREGHESFSSRKEALRSSRSNNTGPRRNAFNGRGRSDARSEEHPSPRAVRRAAFRDAMLSRENEPRRDEMEKTPQSRHPRLTAQRDEEPAGETRRPRRPMMPMAIKYTTAASQFLYGKSVVRAALEQDRRKLYNLYVYGGENRKHIDENETMMRVARRRGVQVTIVPTEEQRLMDKMSMGRPHNGFVLETSPLPKLPVTSLGKLEESAFRLGFHVALDRQTKEEEEINGNETFVKRASDVRPKPFVLLLHEIVDPGNLGAAIRTAAYMGADAVGITNRSSSTLTPVVLKSAAGAAEEMTLFTVDDPVKFLRGSRAAGWKTYAAVAPPDSKLVKMHGDKFISSESLEQARPLDEHPCVLVLGNEGHGLPKQMKVAADYELSVPRFIQKSCVDSLNVSVAAGLLCHAFVKATPESHTAVREDREEDNASSLVDEVPAEDGADDGARLF